MIRRLGLVFVILAAVGLFLSLGGLSDKAHAQGAPAGLQPGVNCTLYFRGDAAGQSVQTYIASVNNNASIAGTLASIDDQWVVINKDKKQFYIPRQVVLMIQVSKE